MNENRRDRDGTKPSLILSLLLDPPEYGWEPMGLIYETRNEAERELLEEKPYYPTAFLVRVVMTRYDERVSTRRLHAVCG